MSPDAEATPPLCVRCKEQEGILDLRSDIVCQTCFTTFIASKAIKRLEVLQRETRGSKLPSRPQRYLLALSRGASSTALLHILSENLRRQRERNQRAKFEVVAVFVDVDVSSPSPSPSPSSPTKTTDTEEAKDPFTTLFPEIPIRTIPLSSVFSLPQIDWSTLPMSIAPNSDLPPSQRLADLLSRLPSPTARADVSRLLTRHALLCAAAAHECSVVLLGYNTTALAELTLTETAKGRGYGIPWLVQDGPVTVSSSTSTSPSTSTSTTDTKATREESIYVYSPLREIFRKEILAYASICAANLFPPSFSSSFRNGNINGNGHGNGNGSTLSAVISHRDLSLDEVVSRYFGDVEASYPSVVANVVRTTGKLTRIAAAHGRWCALCGGELDPLGDERWKGELGEMDTDAMAVADADAGRGTLCYGCERSVKG